MSGDKAGKAYWDRTWDDKGLPRAVNPSDKRIGNYRNRKFGEYFDEIFTDMDTESQTLLEIGCAKSAWLPYFAKRFSFSVHGLDYSEKGCKQAEQILANEGVNGKIVCADFFEPADYMLGFFDAVVSFGVAEHFDDTANCLKAFSAFLKPGGIMITIIPNITGLTGMALKVFNRPVFDIHVPLDRDELAKAHRDAHLDIARCDYFFFLSANLNIENLRATAFYKPAAKLRSLINKAIWAVEDTGAPLKPNRWTSPYIICVATKPCA